MYMKCVYVLNKLVFFRTRVFKRPPTYKQCTAEGPVARVRRFRCPCMRLFRAASSCFMPRPHCLHMVFYMSTVSATCRNFTVTNSNLYLYGLTSVSTITAILTSAFGRENTSSGVENSQRNKTRLTETCRPSLFTLAYITRQHHVECRMSTRLEHVKLNLILQAESDPFVAKNRSTCRN
jgi:hypothetical protein